MKRPNPSKISQESVRAVMGGVRGFEAECAIEKPLRELVKIRASQINGCAFCLNMHVNAARDIGESDERMHLIAAWRDATVFTPRERAGLAWTEVITKISQGGVSDDAYEAAKNQFSEKELVDLTLVIMAINSWNRLMAAFEVPPQLASALKTEA